MVKRRPILFERDFAVDDLINFVVFLGFSVQIIFNLHKSCIVTFVIPNRCISKGYG